MTGRHFGIALAATIIVCALAGVARAEESVTVSPSTSGDGLETTAGAEPSASPGETSSDPADASGPVAESDGAGTSDTTAPTSDTTAPTSDTTAPTSDTTAPTSDAVAPTSDAVAPTSDTTAPTSDTVAPTSDTAPTMSDTAPATTIPIPTESDPTTPASATPVASQATGAKTRLERLMSTPDSLVPVAELAATGEALVADVRARGTPAGRTPHSDAVPPTPDPVPVPSPKAPAPALFGGASGGSASGFSFTVFALLSALLVLARPGLGGVIRLSLSSPHAPLLVTPLQRPG
jgi:hypothetical protein